MLAFNKITETITTYCVWMHEFMARSNALKNGWGSIQNLVKEKLLLLCEGKLYTYPHICVYNAYTCVNTIVLWCAT